MKPSIKRSAQGGFTLIELIVVIVILGILAATALPKFANLGGDARVASLNGARGALTATAAMAHGKWLVSPATVTAGKMTVEGQNINFTTNGYPMPDASTVAAAGLTSADYRVYLAGDKTVTPAVPADSIALVPASLVGTANGANCYVLYTAPTTAAPTVTLSTSATTSPDNCN